MAKIAYVVNDVLGEICAALGIGGWELIEDHYTFSDYDTTLNAVYVYLEGMLYDEDPTNDETAYGYYDQLEDTNYTIMYWSTEKNGWVNP